MCTQPGIFWALIFFYQHFFSTLHSYPREGRYYTLSIFLFCRVSFLALQSEILNGWILYANWMEVNFSNWDSSPSSFPMMHELLSHCVGQMLARSLTQRCSCRWYLGIHPDLFFNRFNNWSSTLRMLIKFWFFTDTLSILFHSVLVCGFPYEMSAACFLN